jgi:hypothetical protein
LRNLLHAQKWPAVAKTAGFLLTHRQSFLDTPFGVGPESILPAGVMDSGLARFARDPEFDRFLVQRS